MLSRCLSFLYNTSLGAPFVGMLWLLCFAKAYAIETHAQTLWLLISSIWLVYAIDRLLEREDSMIQPRHRFHIRHSRIFWTFAVVIVIINGWIIWHSNLPPILYKGGILVGASSTIYLFWVFIVPDSVAKEWMKNILVALVFTIGTTLPIWVTLIENETASFKFLFELLSMALVILTNLRFIGAAEGCAEKLPLETIISGILIGINARLFPSPIQFLFAISYLSQILTWKCNQRKVNTALYDFTLIPVAVVFLAL